MELVPDPNSANSAQSSLEAFFAPFASREASAEKLFPYMHNSMTNFVAGKTSIFYSGPY